MQGRGGREGPGGISTKDTLTVESTRTTGSLDRIKSDIRLCNGDFAEILTNNWHCPLWMFNSSQSDVAPSPFSMYKLTDSFGGWILLGKTCGQPVHPVPPKRAGFTKVAVHTNNWQRKRKHG